MLNVKNLRKRVSEMTGGGLDTTNMNSTNQKNYSLSKGRVSNQWLFKNEMCHLIPKCPNSEQKPTAETGIEQICEKACSQLYFK